MRAWISNYISGFGLDVITHTCFYVNGGLTRAPLMLGMDESSHPTILRGHYHIFILNPDTGLDKNGGTLSKPEMGMLY